MATAILLRINASAKKDFIGRRGSSVKMLFSNIGVFFSEYLRIGKVHITDVGQGARKVSSDVIYDYSI